MSIGAAGLESSMHTNTSHKAQMDALKKLMDVYKDTAKVSDSKRQEVVSAMGSLLSEFQKGGEHMNPPAFHALALKAADLLDKIGAVDPEFLTEAIEELSDSKGKKKVSSHIQKRVQEIEVTAASQFLAIHQVKGTVTKSGSSNFTNSDNLDRLGDFHPALDTVQVDDGIEDRLELGEITGFVMKQQIALENAGVLPSPVDIDIDSNVAKDLTLGGILKLSMQLSEARSSQSTPEEGVTVKSFYTAGAVMMDLIMGVLDNSDAEATIRALLNKPFLSDEDILLIMSLLGDLGLSAPPGLLTEVKDALTEHLQVSAQQATSPTDFLMIAEIVKAISDSSLGDMFDEQGVMSILEGKLNSTSGATTIEELAGEVSDENTQENVDPNVDTSLQSSVDFGTPDSPVDINVLQAATAAANLQIKPVESVGSISEENSLSKVQGVGAANGETFLYDFGESVTKILDGFIQKELDSTLENFAFKTPDMP
jgi:hypothetical protein